MIIDNIYEFVKSSPLKQVIVLTGNNHDTAIKFIKEIDDHNSLIGKQQNLPHLRKYSQDSSYYKSYKENHCINIRISTVNKKMLRVHYSDLDFYNREYPLVEILDLSEETITFDTLMIIEDSIEKLIKKLK